MRALFLPSPASAANGFIEWEEFCKLHETYTQLRQAFHARKGPLSLLDQRELLTYLQSAIAPDNLAKLGAGHGNSEAETIMHRAFNEIVSAYLHPLSEIAFIRVTLRILSCFRAREHPEWGLNPGATHCSLCALHLISVTL